MVDNGARIFFASPKPRKITFTLIIYKIQDATSLSDSPFTEGRGISTSIVEHTVNIGSVDDNPDPDPDPVDPVDPPDQDEPDFSGIAKVIENSAAVKADPTTKNSLARAYLEAHNGITDSTTLQQAIEFKQLKIRTVLRGRPNASVDWTNFQVELDNVFRAADFNKDLSLYKAALLEVSKQLSK